MATYRRLEDLINLGAYKEGANPKVDYSIRMIEKLKGYLRQGTDERCDFGDSLQRLYMLFEGR